MSSRHRGTRHDERMKISLGSDHAGFRYKEKVKELLISLGHEVKIAPWQAALGTELKVPTLEGKVRLKIPPGTQGGQRFRLREQGLPSISGKRGDLYVVVQINIPTKLSEREREIWSQLAKLHGS